NRSIFGGPEIIGCPAEQHDQPVVLFEPLSGYVMKILNQSDHSDYRSRMDAAPVSLVVEADVPARDRSPQRRASFSHAIHGLAELPHPLRSFRGAEVEAIGQGERPRPACHEVAASFGDNQTSPASRINPAVARVRI